MKVIPFARFAAYYHADAVARLRVPDGDDGARTGSRVHGWGGSNYIRRPHIWRKQARRRRGGRICEGRLVAVHLGVAYARAIVAVYYPPMTSQFCQQPEMEIILHSSSLVDRACSSILIHNHHEPPPGRPPVADPR